ncbi:TetR/AcrR family transcriptional regulator [Saccharopolyspora sp. NPDC049426]|uniref:TetR/AcrR family transcriptional regulator n=1 Tax=Saccharopolyspora sp. NPDC049426 TaxID=3155652 RepID=UPI003427CFC2
MSTSDAKETRKRRRRGSIKPEDILAGAFEVARRSSLDDLSMPVLAEHLDVGVTSIYWHFRKKDDLLDAMTDVAAEEFVSRMPAVRADQSWQEMLVEYFCTARAICREDEFLSDLLYTRTSTFGRDTAHRILELIESVLEKLIADGFTSENALKTYNTIAVYVRGVIINDRILHLANAPTIDPARQRQMADWSGMPVLSSLIDHHSLSGTSDEDFKFGLKRLVCGFEDLLREQSKASSRGEGGARSKGSAKRAPSKGK